MSSWRNKALPSLALMLASILFSMLATAFAAIPLRALRVILGRKAYWFLSTATIGFLLVTNNYTTALTVSTLVVLIGSFTEFEKSGDSLTRAATCSILVTLVFLVGSYLTFWSIKGPGAWMFLKEKVNTVAEQATTLYLQYNTGAELSSADIKGVLFYQAPSILLMTFMASLFVAILMEKRVLKLFKASAKIHTYRLSLFKLHDGVIWLFIASLLGSFLKYDNQILQNISLNVFYICMLLLFFQGLAVMAHLFQTLKVRGLWQAFWFFVLIIHLTLFVSLIGLMDYWLNFRLRFARHAAEVRKSQKG